MSDLERLEKGFLKAYEQGDTERAKVLGKEIRRLQSQQSERQRGGQQPAATGREAVSWGNRMGRAGMSALEDMVPYGEKATGFYEDLTGRQITLGREPEGVGEKAVDFATRYAPMVAGTYAMPALRTALGTVKGVGTLGSSSKIQGVARQLGAPERGAQGMRTFWNSVMHPLQSGARQRVATTAARTGDEILNAATRQPWTTAAVEGGGLLGAGAFGAALEDEFGPKGKMAGEVMGGLLGGGLPAAPRAAMNAWKNVKSSYLPFTPTGSREMVARELKPLVRGQTEESINLRLQNAPEGATPFEAMRDPRMRAVQDRIVEDADLMNMSPARFQNERLRDVLANQNLESQLDLTRQGRTLFGPQRDQRRRHVEMVRSVVAPGEEARITDGPLTTMFRQAEASFIPAYNQFRGIPVRDVNLEEQLLGIASPGMGYGADETATVKGFLNNQLSRFSDKIESGTLTTGDLMAIRSEIRKQYRKELPTLQQGGNNDRRNLYNDAEKVLTDIIHGSLSPEQLSSLKQIDSQYRRFKILETASHLSGEDPLTSENLIRATQMATSPHQWATGSRNMDMRDLGRSWRSLENIMDKPDALRIATQNLDPQDLRPLQSEFVNRLMQKAGVHQATPEGEMIPSGQKMMELIGTPDNPGPYRDSMREIAGSPEEFSSMEARVKEIANGLNILQAPADGGRPRLFNEGPAFLFELSAALAGAGTASKIGDALDLGFGTLVIAERLGRKMTADTNRMLMKYPRQLMTDMVVDKELFEAVTAIAMQNTPPSKFDSAVRTLNGWAAALVAEKAQELDVPPLEVEVNRGTYPNQ